MKKIRAAEIEVVDEIDQWTAQSGTRCARFIGYIKGEDGPFKIVAFKEEVDKLISNDFLKVGAKFKASLNGRRGSLSDYIIDRVWIQLKTPLALKLKQESNQVECKQYDAHMKKAGFKKVWLKEIQPGVSAYSWEKK